MPPSRGSTPLSRFTSVDLPDPLGPTMLVVPCRGMDQAQLVDGADGAEVLGDFDCVSRA